MPTKTDAVRAVLDAAQKYNELVKTFNDKVAELFIEVQAANLELRIATDAAEALLDAPGSTSAISFAIPSDEFPDDIDSVAEEDIETLKDLLSSL